MATFKRINILAVFTILTCCLDPCHAGSWYSSDLKGWLWYKKAPKQNLLKPEKEKAGSTVKPEKKLSYLERMEKVRKNLDEIQARAILNPILDNVVEFQRAQNMVLNQADTFQKMLMIAAMMEGQDPSSSAMASPASREIYEQQQDKQLDQDIRSLIASGYGIFFLIKNDCPYCHQFAPVIREFLNTYPFEVKAIAKQGLANTAMNLEGFSVVPDNGTIAKLNPEGIYPTLFLVNPVNGEVIPLAKGMINQVQLKDNFRVVIEFLKSNQARRG